MEDPRDKRARKFYMKVFFQNEDHYKEFLGYYDEAVEDGSVEPESKAMIMFRDRYDEGEDEWIEK